LAVGWEVEKAVDLVAVREEGLEVEKVAVREVGWEVGKVVGLEVEKAMEEG
jgi:hypothetical protein